MYIISAFLLACLNSQVADCTFLLYFYPSFHLHFSSCSDRAQINSSTYLSLFEPLWPALSPFQSLTSVYSPFDLITLINRSTEMSQFAQITDIFLQKIINAHLFKRHKTFALYLWTDCWPCRTVFLLIPAGSDCHLLSSPALSLLHPHYLLNTPSLRFPASL